MKEKLITLVSEQLSRDESDISMKSNFIDDLGADSLDTVELVLTLEDEFNIEIPDEVASTLLTVGDVYTYLDDNIE